MPVRPLRLLAATTLALLIGCGGGSGNPDGGGGNTTVNGQVLDNLGIGRGGATVIVGGKTTTTDATGHFTVSGIATPYDAVIIAPAPDKAATIYSQLTRADPKLLDFDANNGPAHSATVGGAITGGDAFPTPVGEVSAVSWGSVESSTGTYVSVSPYSFSVDWSGAATTTMGCTASPRIRTTRCNISSSPNGSQAFGRPIRRLWPPHKTMPAMFMNAIS